MVDNTNQITYDSNMTNKSLQKNKSTSGLESGEGEMVYEEIKLKLWILAVMFLCIALVAICGNGTILIDG